MINEEYSKIIILSNDIDLDNLSEEEINTFSSMLSKSLVETKLEIAIDVIEKVGLIEEFNEFVFKNTDLNLWTAIEQFVELHPDKFVYYEEEKPSTHVE